MNKPVQKISFKIRFDFFTRTGGDLVLFFSKALACRRGSNHTCTYVTLMSRVIAYDVNCEKNVECGLKF